MELVDTDTESPTLISNVEVMQLLEKKLNIREKQQDAKNRRGNKRPNKHLRHRDWVEEEVHKYLQSTPCVQLDPDRREEFKAKLKGNKRSRATTAVKSDENGTSEITDDNQQATIPTSAAAAASSSTSSTITGFGLTEAESLQIMNMMPSELVEIHLMVDDLQSRMSETRQEEFLQFIQSYSKANRTEGDNITNNNTAPTTGETDETMEEAEDDEPNGDHGVMENGQENGKQPAVKIKKEIEKDTNSTGII